MLYYVYFCLCFVYSNCTVVLIVWTGISAVHTLSCVLAIGLCCFYTLHYVSLCQLLELNDDDDVYLFISKRYRTQQILE